MSTRTGEYHQYAHKVSILAGGIMALFGFLSLFGVNITFGENNFFLNLLMVVVGLAILGIETDTEYIPTRYKIPFKSIRIKSFTYFVLAILLFYP